MKSTGGNPPALLDPFAGGGSIPLEAQRLGLEAHASDLNPVAVMINKAMIEIPPKFAGQPPVNPDSRVNSMNMAWTGAKGLAEDVRYYGEWMKKKAFEKIGHLYPKVKDAEGNEHTVIAWIWARTVKCPNPACGCEMPLASSFELCKKKGKEAYIQPVIEDKNIRYEVRYGKGAPEAPKTARGAKFKCVCCGEAVTPDYIKTEAVAGRMSTELMAIVVEGQNGRLYLSPNDDQRKVAIVTKPVDVAEEELPIDPRAITPPQYGFTKYKDLFAPRHLVTLLAFCEVTEDSVSKIVGDGATTDYAQAVLTYLAFVIDKLADRGSSLCSWDISRESLRNTYGRQALQMIWDYAEGNPFGNSSGCFDNALEWVTKCVDNFQTSLNADVIQNDAQTDNGLRNIAVSTDPPYYDNVPYANISDFFYIWLRRILRTMYPGLFGSMLVPKVEELVAAPYRFDGDKGKAKDFFEKGMVGAFEQIYQYLCESVPLTVYYAFKQSDSDNEEGSSTSTGWETMLSAIIQSGFTITGTWPMRTELSNRMRGFDSNALASSIVLVCRKRPNDAPICTRRDFINALKRELKPALAKLQASNIAPVDLAQSAIGPGMGVYSRFSKVLEADGTPMSIRSALQIINQELDLYFTEQDGELDAGSRFCVDLYTQCAFNDVKFGEADVLARAKNTSIDRLRGAGIVYAEKGVVRLMGRDEIDMTPAGRTKSRLDDGIIWLLTQQLTRALEKDGVVGAAKIIADILTSEPEQAKALAYRLFQIAERKGWAVEAYAYNSLVIGWPEVQSRAAELVSQRNSDKQMNLFYMEEGK
jgi:putative DNA methylase